MKLWHLLCGLLLAQPFFYATDLKNLIESDGLDFNRIEPLTLSTYNERIAAHAQEGFSCIVARILDHNGAHYVDAHQCNKSLFGRDLYPSKRNAASIDYLHPINRTPIASEIHYFILKPEGATYLGSNKDFLRDDEHGEHMRLLFDAQYHENRARRAQAQFNFAVMQHEKNNLAQAVPWYQKVAQQTVDPYAQAHALSALAHLHYAQKNYEQAFHYFQQAARQHADSSLALRAHLGLAELYRFGLGVAQDFVEAEKQYAWVMQHAGNNKERLQAYAGLGELYRLGGFGIERDFGKAAQHYEHLTGCTDCMLAPIAHRGLACMYQQGGCGIEKNFSKAVHYYERLAHNHQDPVIVHDAALNLGDLYRFGGCGLDKNCPLAAQWYEKVLHRKNHPDIQDRATVGLAELYRSGFLGMCTDGMCARDLYHKVACRPESCAYGDCCLGLANLYAEGGNGVEQEREQAITWYTKAIECNNSVCRARAFKQLGDLYRNDAGMKNNSKALPLYAQAAAQKDDDEVRIQAYEILGSIYRTGEGDVPQNIGKAIDAYMNVVELARDAQVKQKAKMALAELQTTMQALVAKANQTLERD